MDVALVASIVTPIRTAAANGPHAVIIDLARGLLARGHRVTVYAAAGSRVPGVPTVEVAVDPAVGASVVRSDRLDAPPNAAVTAAFTRLADELRRRGPDVVSAHAFDAAAIELLEGLPVLHTLHLPPVVPAVVAAARRSASVLATVSVHAGEQWHHAIGREVVVLPNGVPDRGWVAAPIEPRAIIAGRISAEKGTAIAIGAARAAGLQPVMVGDIYDRDYYERAVEPLLENVTFLGPRSRRSLAVLLPHSAALLMAPQWDETFGLVAAEAQMAGCPVVAFRRGALPEVVPHGRGGWLVEPDDEAALVASLRDLDGFDRRAIRADAIGRLGLVPMIDRYEAALTSLAASWSQHVRLAPHSASSSSAVSAVFPQPESTLESMTPFSPGSSASSGGMVG